MTVLRQCDVIHLLTLGLLLSLPATSGAQQRPPILEKTAATRRVTPGSYTWAATAGSKNWPIMRAGPPNSRSLPTWGDYKKAGPLLFSLDHHGTHNGDPLHLFFSNASVKLVGSNAWMDAR
jgi:hypothetical protein